MLKGMGEDRAMQLPNSRDRIGRVPGWPIELHFTAQAYPVELRRGSTRPIFSFPQRYAVGDLDQRPIDWARSIR